MRSRSPPPTWRSRGSAGRPTGPAPHEERRRTMKVICNRAALLEALTVAGNVVAARTPKPVLLCVKLTAEDNALTLAATDLEVARVRGPAHRARAARGKATHHESDLQPGSIAGGADGGRQRRRGAHAQTRTALREADGGGQCAHARRHRPGGREGPRAGPPGPRRTRKGDAP